MERFTIAYLQYQFISSLAFTSGEDISIEPTGTGIASKTDRNFVGKLPNSSHPPRLLQTRSRREAGQ